MALKLLAKSNGVTLESHSKQVAEVAVFIFRDMQIDDVEGQNLNILKNAALLHDISKATQDYQDFLQRKKEKLENPDSHASIAAAFLNQFQFEDRNMIIRLIFWHHGVRIDPKKQKKSLERIRGGNINDHDEKEMISFASKMIISNFVRKQDHLNSTSSPTFIDDENNEMFLILFACLVKADRLVSEAEELDPSFQVSDNYLKNKISNFKKNTKFDHKMLSSDLDLKRFKDQKKIVELAKDSITSIIKAPAGSGKTMIALLWHLRTGGKTLLVCPKNVILDEIYELLIKERKKLNVDCSVEIFRTGKRIKATNWTLPDFCSDIVVTNIDHFLNPTTNNSFADRLLSIFRRNVIFDEYQGFVDEAPLFAEFVLIMRIRHQYTKSKSILLSATPPSLNYLWDNLNPTTILPNSKEHFSAIHSFTYEIEIIEENKFRDDLQTHSINIDKLVIYSNAISTCQDIKRIEPRLGIFHSNFDDEEKERKRKILHEKFGKEKNITLQEFGTSGTPIMRESLDISYHHAYISVCSPETDIQGIGRVNRYGEYHSTSKLRFYLSDKREEKTARGIFYPPDLTKIWFSEVKKLNGKKMTLYELYQLYNQHCLQYEKKRKAYYDEKYQKSYENMKEYVYPKRYDRSQSDIKIAGGNRIRTTGQREIFVIMKKTKSNEWTNPFQVTIRKNIGDEFKENNYGNIFQKIKNIQKKLGNDSRFSFGDYLKKRNYPSLDTIRDLARRSDLPYPVFDRIYDNELGIIKNQ